MSEPKKNLWTSYTQQQRQAALAEGAGLRAFLSAGKTERLCVDELIRQAREAGYRDLYAGDGPVAAGDQYYVNNHGKSLLLLSMGTRPLSEGMNLVGAHVDCPHIDLKLNPFYEKNGLTLAKTHYYGGVRKYQWIAQPLSLVGVVCKKNGTEVRISVGEQPGEPAFSFTDLPPHLAKDQGSKTLREAFTGEDLNALVGALPADGEDEKEPFLKNLLDLLRERYGIEAEDLHSAELQFVPSGPARDAGLDASMVMGFGQDDRASAYAALRGMLALAQGHKRCAAALFVDKEEIGSRGNTGMRSRFFENAIARALARSEALKESGEAGDLALRSALEDSLMLSADVNCAFDPSHPEVSDERNSAYLGRGFAFNKYVGSGGKSGTSDANPEFLAMLRRILDDAGVAYHFAELGKVDQGGGGTISHIMAEYNMQVVDCGVPVLSVHAPWEISHKADVYESVRACACFLAGADIARKGGC